MTQRLTYKIGRLFWQVLALILVLFALTVSLIRGLLPQLDEQRLAQYVEQQYGVQLKLGQLSAKWQAYGPSVSVASVSLPQQSQLPLTFAVQNVQIKLDFWQTLLTLKPQVENVNFDHVYLTLDLDKLTRPAAASAATTAKAASTHTNLDWLYALLLEQLEQYAIDDATVQLVSAAHQYQPIHLRQLRWLNHGQRHRASGALYLDETPLGGEHLSLNVDLAGDGYDPDSIKGQLYLTANQLNLGAWASERSKARNEPLSIPVQGVVNLQAWFDVSQRSIGSGLIRLGQSALDWQQENEQQSFAIDGGDFVWHSTATGWQFSSQGLAFRSNKQSWQDFSVQAERRGKQLYGHVSSIELSALRPLIPLIPGISPTALQQVLDLNTSGQISALNLYQGDDQQLQLSVPIKQVSWRPSAGVPGSAPLDITLALHGGFLSAELPAQAYQLDFGDQFSAPLQFDGEAMKLGFDLAAQRLIVPALALANSDLSLNASAAMDFSESPQLSLSAALQLHDMAKAHRYFPIKAMGKDLSSYLTNAIKAGHTDDAAVVWRGAFADFPYAEQQGVFQAGFTMKQGSYAFQPNWPAVTQLTLDALFENAAMKLHVQQGMLRKVDISGADIVIPTMAEHSQLLVDAKLNARGQDVTEVMKRSPLTSVSSTLNIVQIRGAIEGELHLDIPLYEGGQTDVRGQVAFNNTPVYVSKPGVFLNKLNGNVSFVNELISSEKLTGFMYRQPLSLSFNTGRVNEHFGVNVKLNSQWDLSRLPDELNNPLKPFYSGKMGWNANLRLIFDDTGFRVQANADADLTQTALNMPAPFNKLVGQPLSASAELLGDDKQASLDIRMANLAEFWGSFDVDADNLKSYDVMLGRPFRSGDSLTKQDGKLWLALGETQFNDWQPVIEAFVNYGKVQADRQSAEPVVNADVAASTAAMDATAVPATDVVELIDAAKPRGFFPPLAAIGGNVAQLAMLGHQFTNVNLDAHDTEQSWQFNIDAPEFNGSVEIFPDWWNQGLKVVANHLALVAVPATAADSAATVTEPSQLPPLAVDINDFSYLGRGLGHLVLQGAPSESGYHIQTFSLSSPAGELQGQGDWLTKDGENLTKVNFAVDSANFEQLAAIFDVNPGVKESALKLNANLDWHGSPTAFNLPTLNGDVRFDLGKGHMEQLSDKGARIFSLFSLDSLLRKLSLDFSDVFGKGLYFNSFGGDLRLNNGQLQTTNTEMDAVAGNMNVRGYTDLVSQSLNYDIRFAPKLASSVPTVVLLSTSAWTMGLGAFALTKVLEPVIEVISEIRFRLTGTMANPKLEELERKSKEIEIPKSILPTDNAVDANNTEAELHNGGDVNATDATAPAAVEVAVPAANDASQKTMPSNVVPMPTSPAAQPSQPKLESQVEPAVEPTAEQLPPAMTLPQPEPPATEELPHASQPVTVPKQPQAA
ncbi:TIGR02099 family protein [Shewanella avicenniae]|uniref:TIGR02099 family protein n=1 Tax=Shewanella avicenniae TaxID=2814294 RepID=A0ABX7QPN0_9GAMM|nr:YhdP family protein [Shewanella avicenniae]QSX33229.1 TIGR02099 family protein [Shewanella avicenniae]